MCENVKYDYDALDKNFIHFTNGLASGRKRGTNGTVNGLVYHSCVCQGFTKTMQMLLKLSDISKDHNLIGEEQTINNETCIENFEQDKLLKFATERIKLVNNNLNQQRDTQNGGNMNMNINNYIDSVLEFLYQNKIYNKDDLIEKLHVDDKVIKLKEIANNSDIYKKLSYTEKKQIIDAMVNDILLKNTPLVENNDPLRKQYAALEGNAGYGKTLLEKKSLTTGEMLEIAYCTIGKGSIHLHCGISRKIDYVDQNGKKITHYHALLRKLKQYISNKYQITDTNEIEAICSEEIIKPYIIEALENVVNLCQKYPTIKTIRLDTNDGFFKQVSPLLLELGFVILDECDDFHMEELATEFSNYNFPGDLPKFYQEYPDRKNSVTIHVEDLAKNLEIYKNLGNKNDVAKTK